MFVKTHSSYSFHWAPSGHRHCLSVVGPFVTLIPVLAQAEPGESSLFQPFPAFSSLPANPSQIWDFVVAVFLFL